MKRADGDSKGRKKVGLREDARPTLRPQPLTALSVREQTTSSPRDEQIC